MATSPAPAVVSSPAPQTPEPAQAPKSYQEHTVARGDTLSHLATRYYGDQYKWTKIYEANKSTMKNPNFLFIGQKLFIPS
jgi:nucleoid-associated protein YgaU